MNDVMIREWETEPDYMDGMFFGLPCFIRRHEDFKTLNGYVGVSKNNKYFGQEYNDIDVDVHGGLTFGSGGVHAHFGYYWWFGFDCAHAFDYSPGRQEMNEMMGMSRELLNSIGSQATYRNVPYVQEQCIQLAYQLSDQTLEYQNLNFKESKQPLGIEHDRRPSTN